jgi:nucleoid-associated protein YgaU
MPFMFSHMSSLDEAAVVAAIVTGLRWAALVLGTYLAASVAAGAVAHGLRLGRAARVVDALSLPAARRLVGAALGVGVMGVMGGSLLAVGPTPAGASSVPVMRRLDDSAPPPAATPEPEPAPAPTANASASEWTVRPGDHFWRIAEEVLTERRQRPPTDAETDPYWRRLVDANRQRLVDRDNPDLLFPGQVLVVPPA